LNGTCVLSLAVGIDGVPYDISVVRSIAESQPEKLRMIAQGLDGKAIEAVQQYRFEPATLDGKPVPVSIHIEVRFQMF
jgi:outer membrane biosynthesis protein TonB